MLIFGKKLAALLPFFFRFCYKHFINEKQNIKFFNLMFNALHIILKNILHSEI
ncbi:hypothetical protein SAMN05421638_2020 [Kaistella treverensis]|uniref:Uncharacterized protein n=1 Tax=Kaistella treverensis TaxID=631455 RepID=A0A1I3NDP7_9FLAO|nr:hypothetical protein SAMN05421638_2020 [Kaistella treverensis]